MGRRGAAALSPDYRQVSLQELANEGFKMEPCKMIAKLALIAIGFGLFGCVSVREKLDFRPEEKTGTAVQAAIDAATAAGGGRVVLEKGVYPSGTIYLKSHVELHLEEGAVLRGGARPEDYDDVDDPRVKKVPEKSKKVFVACVGEEDVAITGPRWDRDGV